MILVTDVNGAPVTGAFIAVPGAVDPGRVITLIYGPIQSSSSGTYYLRAIRLDGEVPASGPDTVAVCVRAALPPPLGSPKAPSLMDSVQATLELRPVGSTPVVVEAA